MTVVIGEGGSGDVGCLAGLVVAGIIHTYIHTHLTLCPKLSIKRKYTVHRGEYALSLYTGPSKTPLSLKLRQSSGSKNLPTETSSARPLRLRVLRTNKKQLSSRKTLYFTC